MKIGVKYCGGCNPQYNRSSILERVKQQFPWIQLESVKQDVIYDWVFVICGCKAECVDMKELKGHNGVFLIYSIQKYMEIEDSLKKYFEQNGV